ncbi:hypothetical protein [Umezawaea sp. Da 62-37]|nr:hypothetical protein [Umezawaea sp. Da 62-37]WNV85234.1 hypothetical protein RM788_45095 [Umezawaea sp. Da 62-37]
MAGLGSCLLLFTRIDGSVLRGPVLIGPGVVLAAVNLVRARRTRSA